MEDTKYYKPDVSEFHINFEYEVLNPIGWTKESMSWQSPHEVFSDLITMGEIRVKYLDKEDIESLGFKYTGKAVDIWFEKEGSFSFGTLNSNLVKGHYGLHDNRLYIETYDYGDRYPLFEGIIKNKSELKVLLKQLGV